MIAWIAQSKKVAHACRIVIIILGVYGGVRTIKTRKRVCRIGNIKADEATILDAVAFKHGEHITIEITLLLVVLIKLVDLCNLRIQR